MDVQYQRTKIKRTISFLFSFPALSEQPNRALLFHHKLNDREWRERELPSNPWRSNVGAGRGARPYKNFEKKISTPPPPPPSSCLPLLLGSPLSFCLLTPLFQVFEVLPLCWELRTENWEAQWIAVSMSSSSSWTENCWFEVFSMEGHRRF